MKREGSYYKKVVNYEKNSEPDISLFFGALAIGVSLGILIGLVPDAEHVKGLFLFLILGISLIVLNFFITNTRDVIYEKYEVKKR